MLAPWFLQSALKRLSSRRLRDSNKQRVNLFVVGVLIKVRFPVFKQFPLELCISTVVPILFVWCTTSLVLLMHYFNYYFSRLANYFNCLFIAFSQQHVYLWLLANYIQPLLYLRYSYPTSGWELQRYNKGKPNTSSLTEQYEKGQSTCGYFTYLPARIL